MTMGSRSHGGGPEESDVLTRQRRLPHWSQVTHVVLVIGLAALGLAERESHPQVLLYVSGAVAGGVLFAAIRWMYPVAIRRRQLAVQQEAGDAQIFVSWAISDRAILARSRFSEIHKGWAVVAVDDSGIRVWPRDRRLPPTLAIPMNQIVGIKLADSRRGPIAIDVAHREHQVALFPLDYRWGEYFQMSGRRLQALADRLLTILPGEKAS